MRDDEPITMKPAGEPYRPERRRSGGLFGCLFLAFAVLVLLLIVNAVNSVGQRLLGPASGDLGEVLVEGHAGQENRILLLPIDGMILDGDPGILGGRATTSPHQVRRILDAARENPKIKGVLVEVNSPGGGVTASDMIYDEIHRYSLDTGQPVVAYFKDVAASGGYYVSMAADEIVAHPTTLTGSIGVIMRLLNYAGLYDKLGLRDVTILSDHTPMKDMGSPTRDMTPQERERFTSIVDEMYQRFVGVVDKGRAKLDHDAVIAVANGSVYSASQALERGLVDSIGQRRDALAAVRRRAGIEEASLVTYERPPSLLESLLMSAMPGHRLDERLGRALDRIEPSASGLLYLWPGWSTE